MFCDFTGSALGLGERIGSGDGERNTFLTRQIAFKPLPASVSFALVLAMIVQSVFIVMVLFANLYS